MTTETQVAKGNGTNMLKSEKTGDAEVRIVRISAIHTDKLENYRGSFENLTKKEEEELQQLAKSIAAAGLIHPVAVIDRGNGEYDLAAGGRRFYAVTTYLKWSSILSNVYPAGTNPLAVQTAENTARKDVNSYRLAKRLAVMVLGDQERGLAPAHEHMVKACDLVGSTVGMSGSSVKNMVRVVTKASPKVLEAWEKHGSELPIRLLIEWCVLPHEEQDKLLEAYITRRRSDLRAEKDGEGGKGKGKRGKGKHGHSKRSMAEIKEKYEALSTREDELSKVRAKCLAWVMGERETM